MQRWLRHLIWLSIPKRGPFVVCTMQARVRSSVSVPWQRMQLSTGGTKWTWPTFSTLRIGGSQDSFSSLKGLLSSNPANSNNVLTQKRVNYAWWGCADRTFGVWTLWPRTIVVHLSSKAYVMATDAPNSQLKQASFDAEATTINNESNNRLVLRRFFERISIL